MHKHAHRINHVINFTHTHLDKDLDLDTLANIACLSKYHFIKVFTEYAGETPMSFLKRVRLEMAAHLLSYNREVAITDIALTCGYSSGSVFSRAFSDKFSISPKAFRSTHINSLPYISNNDVDNESSLEQVVQRLSLYNCPINVIQQPAIKVAYMRSIGCYGENNNISEAEEIIKHWAKKQGLLNEQTKIIGVSWDNDLLTPSFACKYDVCIKIPDNYPKNTDVSIQTIPSGLYTVFSAPFQAISDLPYIWQYFSNELGHLLNRSNHPAYSGAGYEILRQNPLDGETYIDLYYPSQIDNLALHYKS